MWCREWFQQRECFSEFVELNICAATAANTTKFVIVLITCLHSFVDAQSPDFCHHNWWLVTKSHIFIITIIFSEVNLIISGLNITVSAKFCMHDIAIIDADGAKWWIFFECKLLMAYGNQKNIKCPSDEPHVDIYSKQWTSGLTVSSFGDTITGWTVVQALC